MSGLESCPYCEDVGFTVQMTGVDAECCGNILPCGGCCNIPVPVETPEQVGCQWCHENPKSKFNDEGS